MRTIFQLLYLQGNFKQRKMCTCIDNIKTSYSEVKRNASRISRKSFVVPVADDDNNKQPSIDVFLDAINLITKELYQLTNSIVSLVEIVRNNFCEITKSEAQELLQLSVPICEKMEQLHKKLLKSPLYVGMETVVGIYVNAMNDFTELCNDLRFFRIDLEKNTDFQNALAKLNESLS